LGDSEPPPARSVNPTPRLMPESRFAWPAGTDHYMHGGASIWNTPALDPELGLVYFSVGNCWPDYDGSMREGDNLFCTSIVALNTKTGQYAWHFQEVHHDIGTMTPQARRCCSTP